MLPLGLTGAEQRAFTAALAVHHSIRVETSVLNMDGVELTRLDPAVIGGQVNVDARAAVTRSCTLSILDPDRSLSFDSDSPADGALYLDRQIRVVYGVKVADPRTTVDRTVVGQNYGERQFGWGAFGATAFLPGVSYDWWVEVPVFTGPVTKMDRANDLINVECQGVESYGLEPYKVWRPITFKKGHNKVAAMRTLLRDGMGQTRFDFPDLGARLRKPLSVARGDEVWPVARKLARSLDRQLLMDGRAVSRLRRMPGHLFTFSSGDGGLVVSPPQVSYSTESMRNTVWVKGGKPRGVKTDNDPASPAPKQAPDIGYHEVAKASDPHSPQRLKRNGVPLHAVELIENDKLRSVAEARRLARRKLGDLADESVDVTFESLPVPHLEPGDVCRVSTVDGTFRFRLGSFSLPLQVGENMSVGFHKNVSPPLRRNRR